MKLSSILYIAMVGMSLPTVAETVVGEFAPVGYIGAKTNTLTMIEAHTVCLNESGVGYSDAEVTTSSFESAYSICMREYTPFRTSGEGLGGDCETEAVTWGQCGGVVNSGYQGISSFVRNTTNSDYEGYGNFMCVNNKWVYLSGGCSRTADYCEAGAIVQWGVTSPLWADIDPDTVYTDKYGKVRHSPKENCAASMEKAYSGDYVQQYITAPETDLARYNSNSNAPQRCFDGNWMQEPIDAHKCNYVPKSCSAKSVSYNGCSFDIPALEHDEIYVDSSPSPYRSVGHSEAYCFDGVVEIKSQSCQLSCESTFEANQWLPENATDNGQCGHSVFDSPTRMSPNSTRLVENEVDGMSGNITYICKNGVTSTLSSTCAPTACTKVEEATWTGSDGSICYHDEISGFWESGEVYNKSSDNDIFKEVGAISYQCNNGVMESVSSVCEDSNEVLPCVSAEIELPPASEATEVPPSDGFGGGVTLDVCEETHGSAYRKVNNACCTVDDSNGELARCYAIP